MHSHEDLLSPRQVLVGSTLLRPGPGKGRWVANFPLDVVRPMPSIFSLCSLLTAAAGNDGNPETSVSNCKIGALRPRDQPMQWHFWHFVHKIGIIFQSSPLFSISNDHLQCGPNRISIIIVHIQIRMKICQFSYISDFDQKKSDRSQSLFNFVHQEYHGR